METLERFRKEIDVIDAELVKLFEKRMDIILKVGKFKKANQVQILHQSREKEVLEKAQKMLQNKDYSEALNQFLSATMKISKALQKALIHDE
jgi:chorismate mutase/prephenate dehydratase